MWTPKTATRRAFEVLREEGPRSLLFKIMGETAYRRLAVFEYDLDAAARGPGSVPGLAFELLSPERLDEYVSLRPDADPGEVRRRLVAGHRCFLARLDGEIAHAAWTAIGSVQLDYLGRELNLGPRQISNYDAFTAPAFRGKRISPIRISHVAGQLLGEGYEHAVVAILPENRSSLEQVKSMAAPVRLVGMIGYVKLGPWRRDFTRAARRPLRGLPTAT